MQQFYPINTPLINYFFYKAPLTQNGPNVPLAGGFIFFYDDTNHSNPLPTYSDVSNPNLPVLNTNPIQLGAAGECPLFYLLNQLYYIVITDSTGNQGNPVATISHYDPANGTSTNFGNDNNSNMIPNGQFNYPIVFTQTNQTPGLITQSATRVAWGWTFQQDVMSNTENIITFNNIAAEVIEGNPINEINLLSQNIVAGESAKDFVTIFGNVNFMEGQQITFSIQAISYLSGNSPIVILLEKNYGQNGSPTEIFTIVTFPATTQRKKFSTVYTIPSNAGKTIGENDFCAIHIQPSLGQICNVAFTNVLIQPGSILTPTYETPPYIKTVANILGESTQIEPAGLPQNYSFYMYSGGQIFPFAPTGEMFVYPLSAPPLPYALQCNGQTLSPSGYTNNIPNQRLYNVIGVTYGGGSGLQITSQDNIITFNSVVGGREHSVYTKETTNFDVTQTSVGLFYNITAAVTGSNSISVTWVGNFAIEQITPAPPVLPQGTNQQIPGNGVMGNWFTYGLQIGVTPVISVATLNPGSGIAAPSVSLTFNSGNIADYSTRGVNIGVLNKNCTVNFLEYALATNNTRGTYFALTSGWIFTVDNYWQQGADFGIGIPIPFFVPFKTALTLSQNLVNIVQAINNPFIWTITVTAVPTQSEYFFYSSITTDYYAWYKVDGVGTDPAIVGRTGTEIDINSTDSVKIIAEKTALALNTFAFNLPNVTTHLPTIPGTPPLSAWFINI